MTQEIQDKIDLIKAPFAGVIEAADALPAMVDEREKLKFEEGFQAALVQAGQAGGSDKIYSDAEMEAEIKPRDEKIALLTTQLAEMQVSVSEKVAAIVDLETKATEKQAELDGVKAELEALKAEFDSKVLVGSEARVSLVKEISKEALAKMVTADQPLADEALAKIDEV